MSKRAQDALQKLKSKRKTEYERVMIYLKPEEASVVNQFCKKHNVPKATMFREAAKLFIESSEK
jgi:hypothetical protein